MSNVATFHINVTFNTITLWVNFSNSLTIAKPEISSKNGASTFINFCSFGFNIIFSFGNIRTNLFKKLKQHSHELITPSNSNTFLIPKTRSTFSWISDTNVYILNLWSCISIIIGIMKSTLTYCPLPTWILCVFDANFGNECSDLQHK